MPSNNYFEGTVWSFWLVSIKNIFLKKILKIVYWMTADLYNATTCFNILDYRTWYVGGFVSLHFFETWKLARWKCNSFWCHSCESHRILTLNVFETQRQALMHIYWRGRSDRQTWRTSLPGGNLICKRSSHHLVKSQLNSFHKHLLSFQQGNFSSH